MTDEVIVHGGPLTQYLPQDGKGLMVLAEQVSIAGMFQNGRNPLTKSQAFVMMVKGAELGLSPMQSLEHISIIKGKPFVGAAVISARIRQSPALEAWEVDAGPKVCSIRFKRKGSNETTLTTKIEDIPQRYFKPSQNGEPSNWTLIPEDMLFAWTVRRVARRHFPDALLDLGDAVQDEPREVIDVAAVERTVGKEESVEPCKECGEPSYLHASGNGGAYSECANGHRQSPPQVVRDRIRGRTQEFIDMPASELPEATTSGPEGREPTPEEVAEIDLSPPPVEGDKTPVLEATASEAAAETSGPPLPSRVPFSGRWRTSAADAIIDYLASAKGGKRTQARQSLQNLGWDGETGVTLWIHKVSDDGLTRLLELFDLTVGINGNMEPVDA